VFIYIWAGPHHLLNTALPPWLQGLGMTFSLMLWAPSWGGMLNGLLTLRGAWDKLRTDPVVKFFAAGVTFYGMATFEGPLLSIKSVNALSHYSDWTIGHVHSGTLGWNGFMAAGMFYWLAPRLWKTKLFSTALANMHFWLGMVGILLYIASMWFSGITQGLMLNETIENGTVLKHASFVETIHPIRVYMGFRVFGGALYLFGYVLMIYNICKTVASGQPVNGTIEVAVEDAGPQERFRGFLNAPVLYTLVILTCAGIWMFANGGMMLIGLFGTVLFTIIAIAHFEISGAKWGEWYERLLEHGGVFTTLTLIAAAIGGAIQIIPTVTLNRATNVEDRIQVPYTPLELAGRDIYVSEGCYNCHSQMIRTLVPDVLRYGDYSRLGESIYDHPFQWGSKRTGPDLAREGNKRNNYWHYRHFMDPPSMSEGSNMPKYTWLAEKETDLDALPAKINALRRLGVPYSEDLTAEDIRQQALEQAIPIAKSIQAEGEMITPEKQMVALIAYLQKLGTFEERNPQVATRAP